MRIETLVKDTLELKGFRVAGVEGDTEEIVVRIVPDGRYAPRCGQCGGKGRYRDRRRERRYRHVPLWGIPVTLVYTLRRVRCERCGVRVEAVPWAEGKQRFTRAMSATMAEWARLLPWSHVARLFGCSWPTVEQAVKAAVAWGRQRQDLSGLTHIGVDEIARKRGHVYMTVVYDLKERRLVWAGEGRTRETLERFFDSLGEEGSKRLEAVCCDMWRPYVNAVRARAPQAVIVFDKFHIVSHLGKAVDDVRRQEIREKGRIPVAEEPVAPHRRPGRAARDPRQAEHGGPPGLPVEGDVPALLGVQVPGPGQALPRALVRLGRRHRALAAAKVRPHDAPPHGRHSQLLPRPDQQRCRGRHEQQGQGGHATSLRTPNRRQLCNESVSLPG